jgi:hypothetical protein
LRYQNQNKDRIEFYYYSGLESILFQLNRLVLEVVRVEFTSRKMVTMENIALQANGSMIISSTCEHSSYPCSNILDGSLNTFWSTTGMYPQEFILKLPEEKTIKKVILTTSRGSSLLNQ